MAARYSTRKASTSRVVPPPLAEFGVRERLGDEVALRQVAAEAPQLVAHRLLLDAFGAHPHAEVVARVDRGAHQRRVAPFLQHVPDKRLVDLELVYRELAQVRERGE